MNINRFLLAGLMAFSSLLSLRAEEAPTDYSAPAPGTTPSVVGQAAEAVVGRVFGVEGDASEIKYHAIEFTSHTPAASATRSLLIPGWGQYFNRQKAKGTIFFATTVGAIVASAHVYGNARDSYDEYKAVGDKDGSKYDDYKRDRDRAVLLGGVAAVVWIISIVDAHRNAYKPLYSQSSSVDVAFLEDGGAQVRYRRGF